MIKEIQIASLQTVQDIISIIENAELNARYNLPNFYFKWLRVDSSEDGYCWALEYNYYVSGYVSYTYPMKDSQRVKVFKTISGAKRNLIKYFTDGENVYFRNLKPQEND